MYRHEFFAKFGLRYNLYDLKKQNDFYPCSKLSLLHITAKVSRFVFGLYVENVKPLSTLSKVKAVELGFDSDVRKASIFIHRSASRLKMNHEEKN